MAKLPSGLAPDLCRLVFLFPLFPGTLGRPDSVLISIIVASSLHAASRSESKLLIGSQKFTPQHSFIT